jgi:carbon-monoxide dehydrogenase small subunit
MAGISISVNGTRREIEVSGDIPLLYVLRGEMGLSGPQFGCGLSQCGSCSVLLDGELLCACLVLAASAVGRDIRTVEGLGAHGELTDVQIAFIEEGAVQCGFCTPGLIVAVHDLLERTPVPSDLQVREALAGNVCRCTGYGRILEAVHAVARSRVDG